MKQDIQVYITPGCQACEATLQWFDKKKIAYTKKIVYPNTEEETFLRKHTKHNFVPIVVINGKVLDPNKLWFEQLEKELSEVWKIIWGKGFGFGAEL